MYYVNYIVIVVIPVNFITVYCKYYENVNSVFDKNLLKMTKLQDNLQMVFQKNV